MVVSPLSATAWTSYLRVSFAEIDAGAVTLVDGAQK
jgi:hypothetical protein